MEHVAIDDVEIDLHPMDIQDVRRPVSAALGTEHLAMNYFELAPGDRFSGGPHTHGDQEEIFYVESGTATFDVGRDGKRVTVGAGELIRFAPGEYQTGYVAEDADEDVVGWAIGAPGARHDWGELESIVYCRECEAEHPHTTEPAAEARFRLTCTECGNAFTI